MGQCRPWRSGGRHRMDSIPIRRGESFLASFFDTCAVKESALVRPRFYSATFALQEALFGIENDDIGAFRRGVSPYV